MSKIAKIAISLPEDVLNVVEEKREESGESRSQFFRRAVEVLLKVQREREQSERYIRSYSEKPETAQEIEAARDPPVTFLPGSRGMRRGEIWWAKFDPPAGRRPVVLLSRNEAYIARSLIIVAPVTTHIRNISSEILLDKEDGMPQRCAANMDIITTVPKDCLKQRITALTPKKMIEMETAIHFALGME